MVVGCLFLLVGLAYFLRLCFPDLPWHLLQTGESGGGPVETWQVVTAGGGLCLLGLWVMVVGLRMRGRCSDSQPSG